MTAKVSVILVLDKFSYKEFSFIKTLREQSLEEIEILIFSKIQDEKTENKLKILSVEDKRISVISLLRENKPFRKYIRFIHGEYIYFASPDMKFSFGRALEYIHHVAAVRNIDVLICNYDVNKAIKNPFGQGLRKDWFFDVESRRDILLGYNTLENCIHLYKKDFILQNHLFPADSSAFSEAVMILKAYVTAPSVKYLHKVCLFKDNNEMKAGVWRDYFAAFDKFYRYLSKYHLIEKYEQAFLNGYANHIYVLLRNFYTEPEFTEITDYLKDTVNVKYDFLSRPKSYYKEAVVYDELSHLFYAPAIGTAPKNQKKKVYVALPSSEELVPYTGVTLCSILDRISDEYFYDIYVLHQDLTYNSIRRLSALSRANVRISCCNVMKPLEDIRAASGQEEALPYIKILAPKILENCKKIIWIEPFVQVLRDVAVWDKVDVRRKCIVSIPDNGRNVTAKRGVMVINPKLFRDNFVAEQYIVCRKNFDEDVCLDAITEFCNYFTGSAEENYRLIENANCPAADEEMTQTPEWWQYAGKTEFYEWILYLTAAKRCNDA